MIEICPGKYGVDSKGNVYSLRSNSGALRKTPMVMKQRLTKEGYMTVVFWLDGKTHLRLVHRLVAEAFIRNPKNKPEVNHIDGNKQNNTKKNLAWATKSENAKHAFELGLRVGSTALKGCINEQCVNSKPVMQLSMAGELIKLWPSMAEAKRNGFSQGNISSVIAGKRGSHKGFKWAFL
jgi:hypothetical protein